MKLFFLTVLLLTTACSGKKRVPFDQKLKDLQFAEAQARAQAEASARQVPESKPKKTFGRDGFLCEAITRSEKKDVFLVPQRRSDSDRVSYDFFEVSREGELKALGLELDGILFYHFEGKYVENKDGSVTDAVKGLAVSRRADTKDTVHSVIFLVEDSFDRGISVTVTLEVKKARRSPVKSELAQVSSCVKTTL